MEYILGPNLDHHCRSRHSNHMWRLMKISHLSMIPGMIRAKLSLLHKIVKVELSMFCCRGFSQVRILRLPLAHENSFYRGMIIWLWSPQYNCQMWVYFMLICTDHIMVQIDLFQHKQTTSLWAFFGLAVNHSKISKAQTRTHSPRD